MIGLTCDDLYAGAATTKSHYVGGLTDMMGRSAVFSFARMFDMESEEEEVSECFGELPPPTILARSLKVVAHEVCHCLGFSHCAYFNCLMQGMNHQREYESIFFDLCPVCLHKLAFMTGLDPAVRYVELQRCMRHLTDGNNGATFQ